MEPAVPSNRDTSIAFGYHRSTKHSPVSVRTSRHYLDWDHQPLRYKLYPKLGSIPLPRDFSQASMPTLEALSGSPPESSAAVTLERMAQMLFYTGGITKKLTSPSGEEMHFRAASCAGALYPIELYPVCAEMDGLGAGVYHFNPGDFALRCLQAGDRRGDLARAAGDHPGVSEAPGVLVFTDMFWRSAWKYEARSYRHAYWDSGVMVANLLAVSRALGLRAEVVMGFDDDAVNRLLGVDGRTEAAVVLVPLGSGVPARPPAVDAPGPAHETVALSERSVEYPEILRMHLGSSLAGPGEVRRWRAASPISPPLLAAFSTLPVPPPPQLRGAPLGPTIVRRGSSRVFLQEPIPREHLSAILHHSTRGLSADFLPKAGDTFLDILLIVNAVSGLLPGAYHYDPLGGRLGLLKEGKFRGQAGYLGLEQSLPADAAADVFLLADLGLILEGYGNRGYRAAQMEAAAVGGRMYLAAYSLGLGATGLTFYDDEVVKFFDSPGREPMFMVCLGVPGKRGLPSGTKLIRVDTKTIG